MVIEDFNLAPCSNCDCAKFSFYDDARATEENLIGLYCGSGWADAFLQSGGNLAFVEYDSYAVQPGQGFKVRFEFYNIEGEKVYHIFIPYHRFLEYPPQCIDHRLHKAEIKRTTFVTFTKFLSSTCTLQRDK